MAGQRRSFSAEVERKAASLVLDQGYFMAEASRSLDVGETALTAEQQHRYHAQDRGTHIGRFKVRALMRESGLIGKQPGPA